MTLVPTRHWSARNLSDRNMALWASFVIETPGGRIYFVGDSGYGDGRHFRDARERHGPFRLAILPIGAYEPRWFMRDQHMNPAEAVQASSIAAPSSRSGIITARSSSPTRRSTRRSLRWPTRCRQQNSGRALRALRPGQVWQASRR